MDWFDWKQSIRAPELKLMLLQAVSLRYSQNDLPLFLSAAHQSALRIRASSLEALLVVTTLAS